MKDLSKNILSKIKNKNIKPKPKWKFLLKENFLWGFFVFSVLLGGVSVSIIFFQVMTNEWDVAERVSGSLFYFALISLPYFWILVMLGFSFLSYHYLRKTKSGYKYSLLSINITSISLSIILGALLFVTGMSLHIHRMMHENFPMYDEMMNIHHEILSNPDKGIVMGKVLKIESKDILIIRDRSRDKWDIDISNAKKILIDNIEIGDRMIVIGEKGDKIIYADIIRSGERRNIGGMMPFSRFHKEGMSRPDKRQFNLR